MNTNCSHLPIAAPHQQRSIMTIIFHANPGRPTNPSSPGRCHLEESRSLTICRNRVRVTNAQNYTSDSRSPLVVNNRAEIPCCFLRYTCCPTNMTRFLAPWGMTFENDISCHRPPNHRPRSRRKNYVFVRGRVAVKVTSGGQNKPLANFAAQKFHTEQWGQLWN